MLQRLRALLFLLPTLLTLIGSGLRAVAGTSDALVSAPALGNVEIVDTVVEGVKILSQGNDNEVSLPGNSSFSACPDTYQSYQNFSSITFPDKNIPDLTIKVTGNTVFSREQLIEAVIEVTESWEELSNFQEDLPEQVAGTITNLYQADGYINSQARVKGLENGVLEVCAIEGSLAEIQIFELIKAQGGKVERTGQWAAYIRKRIQLGVDTPLNTANLEDQLRLLREDPIIGSIEASLVKTGIQGQSILQVSFTRAKLFGVSLGLDNYSPPSVGSD